MGIKESEIERKKEREMEGKRYKEIGKRVKEEKRRKREFVFIYLSFKRVNKL